MSVAQSRHRPFCGRCSLLCEQGSCLQSQHSAPSAPGALGTAALSCRPWWDLPAPGHRLSCSSAFPGSPALLKPSFLNAVDLTELSLHTSSLPLTSGWVYKPRVVTASCVLHCTTRLVCSKATHTQKAGAAINPLQTTAVANGLWTHTSKWCKSRILKAQMCCWRE